MRLAAVLCLALAGPAAADPFAQAIAAFRAGDAGRAAVIFKTLAEAGDAEAQFNLALIYAEGAGLPQNPREALFWAWLARIEGVAPAEVLADKLQSALPPDACEALAARLEARLAPRVAEGDSAAMLGLARVLLHLRPKPDARRAYEWLAIAAALGQPEAARARDATLAAIPEKDRFKVQDGALEAFAVWCREAKNPAPACAAAG